MAQTPARKFGNYELIEKIGYGGMAEVYRARYTPAQGVTKSVVIKRILPHMADSKKFVSMFNSEARISMGLSHGNIAQIFDFGQIDDTWFLAMELVDGQPLSKVLQRVQGVGIPFFPASIAVHVAIEMCKGLHYAHTRTDEKGRPLDIVHRDVSPDNVLISYEGQVKLVDFGIAKARLAGRLETEPGVVRGKYMYLSPEQARGEELDARTDVFATGVVLFRLLSGRLPVEGSEYAVLAQLAQGKVPRLRDVNPELPRGLDEVLVRAMAPDRARRYASSQALQDALTRWLNETDPGFSASTLGYFMGYLFREELDEELRPPRVPREFSERAEQWKRSAAGKAGSTSRERATPPRPQPERAAAAHSEESITVADGASSRATAVTITEDAAPSPDRFAPRSWKPFALVGAGVAVLILVVLGVIGLVVPAPAQVVPPPRPIRPVTEAPKPISTRSFPAPKPPSPEEAAAEARQTGLELDFHRLMQEGDEAATAGRTDDAMDAYGKALALVPGSGAARISLGVLLVVSGHASQDGYRRATRLLQDGLAIEPDDARGWLALGIAEFLLREPAKGRVAYGKYLALDPARAMQSTLRVRVRDLDMPFGNPMDFPLLPPGVSDRDQGSVLVLGLPASKARFILVSRLPRLNATEAARRLDGFARGNPGDSSAWLALGMAYQSLRQESKAAAAYKRFLALEPSGNWAEDVEAALARLEGRTARGRP